MSFVRGDRWLLGLVLALCSIPSPGVAGEVIHLGLEGVDVRRIFPGTEALYVAADTVGTSPGGVWRYDRTTEEWTLLGFDGQRVGEAILILEESPDRLLVGVYPIPGDTTRIYRTDNGGESWEPSDHGTCGASIPRVRALAQDPADPDHILAGGNALFASFDEGHTWSTSFVDLGECGGGSFSVRSIAYADENPDRVVFSAPTAFGASWFVRSNDGGLSWEYLLSTIPPAEWMAYLPGNPDVVLLTMGSDFTAFNSDTGRPLYPIYDGGDVNLAGGCVHPQAKHSLGSFVVTE